MTTDKSDRPRGDEREDRAPPPPPPPPPPSRAPPPRRSPQRPQEDKESDAPLTESGDLAGDPDTDY